MNRDKQLDFKNIITSSYKHGKLMNRDRAGRLQLMKKISRIHNMEF